MCLWDWGSEGSYSTLEFPPGVMSFDLKISEIKNKIKCGGCCIIQGAWNENTEMKQESIKHLGTQGQGNLCLVLSL